MLFAPDKILRNISITNIMGIFKLSPWFNVRTDGTPIRDGIYEGCTVLITSPKLSSSTVGYRCLWEGGQWKNIPDPNPNVLNISGPPNPDYWRGILIEDQSGK